MSVILLLYRIVSVAEQHLPRCIFSFHTRETKTARRTILECKDLLRDNQPQDNLL